MKLYEVTGTGSVDTLWPMARESGQQQKVTFFMRTTGTPSSPLVIELLPSGGISASGDVFPVYSGTPAAGGVILEFSANGPFTIRVRSSSSGAGGFVVFAQ